MHLFVRFLAKLGAPLSSELLTTLFVAVLVKVAGWRVFGGLGLSCGGKNSLGRADFSWILEYLEEKSWESIGIKNFCSF